MSFFRSSERSFLPPGGRAIAAFVMLACSGAGYGMDPSRAMSQYVHDRWGREQGFPAGPVYAITQTADGYLWIASGAGLVRFDGWTFQLIQDSSGTFTIGSVLGLTPDRDGGLWLRLQDLTLVRYSNGTFDRPASVEGYSGIEAMSLTNRGDLLVAKSGTGALAFRGRIFQLLAGASKLPMSPVTALGQTGNGEVWIGTRDAGLFRFARGKMISVRKGLPDLKVNCVLPTGDEELWAGTDNGVVRWKGGELSTAGIPAAPQRFQALVMVQDRDGNVWTGTDSRGLLRINSQGLAALNDNGEMAKEAVTALFEDREGNLWIGHAGGIERLRDSAFVSYSVPEGLPTDGSNPLFVDTAERLWFPPVTGGLWWAKNGEHGRITRDGLDRDIIYSIAGGRGELWVGRQRGGLTRLRYDANSFGGGESIESRTYSRADGLAGDAVYSVFLARDGTVWAGTLSAGVSALRNGRFANYTVADGLASNTVASLLEASDGTMWFATPGGLSAMSNGKWKTYRTADGLPSDNVNCLLVDSSGMLWVGTASGLAFRNEGKFGTPAEASAVLREPIFGLAEDRFGSLWLATSNHVLRVDREKLLHGALKEGDLREYGPADGLRGVEGVKRHQSVIADPLGRVWFSLNRGISVVDPVRLTKNSAAPIVHVQTISADGKRIPTESPIRIPGGRQRINFAYVGLNLSIPKLVRYKYRLDGFDRDWSDATANLEAVYTNLSPRSYRFRVMARDPDGAWSSNEAALDFEVEPLFWQTWWFRMSVVLVCAIGVMGVYWLRLRQLTRTLNLRFQERLAERTRIAQELHDTLLQGFLSASMQVHVAADCLAPDSSAKPMLNRSLELMRQVIDEGRNAVRGLRSTQSASLDLEQAFSRIREELTQPDRSGAVEFRVIVDGQRRALHPLLRDEVYRIGREALVNAFHHAKAKKIEIELEYLASKLNVTVRDDGNGIDPEVLRSGRDGHWGLSGMRERADRIGARLNVYSSAASGTEIKLSVPGHVAFQKHSEMRGKWYQRLISRLPAQDAQSRSKGHKND